MSDINREIKIKPESRGTAQVVGNGKIIEVSSGILDVAEERAKQQRRFSAKDDDKYTNDELTDAAILILCPTASKLGVEWPFPDYTPVFDDEPDVDPYYKRLRMAAALIIAEIDRIKREE